MAGTKTAVGILFEVLGGGNVDGASFKRINGQLRQIMGEINKSDTPKLKIQVDTEHLKKQLKGIVKDVQNIGESGKKAGSSNKKSQAKEHSAEYTKAKEQLEEYYKVLKQVQKAASRSEIELELYQNGSRWKKANFKKVLSTEDGKNRWGALDKQYKSAYKGLKDYRETLKNLSQEEKDELVLREKSLHLTSKVQQANIDAAADSSWSKQSQKVHDYIKRIEHAASRSEEASNMMRELDEIASSEDPSKYDELLQKYQKLVQYVNANGLDEENWLQKFTKAFGSHIYNAAATAIIGKLGQAVAKLYTNVVSLDASMTNLQIATGMNRLQAKELIKAYGQLAQQLSATTAEVAESADTWLRQGKTIEETNELIKSTMMLSKLGQIEAADASKALTSSLNGYNLEATKAMSITDKLTAVDMVAATSAGGIATAMAETATSAEIAGVSMDKLIGYIATVSEVTQDADESVGTFYRTLFARMNNIAAGNFVDSETGEALNDVEKTLNKLGISLRDTNGLFRNSAEVLDEVAGKWETFDNIEQHAIATAMAGTRQQEKLMVLLSNYGSALEYAETAANSAGTAQEKYTAYTESFEGAVTRLTASWETFSMTVLDSDVLIWAVNAIEMAVTGLNNFAEVGNGTVATIAALTAALSIGAVAVDLMRVKLINYIKKTGEAATVTAAFSGTMMHLYTTGLGGVLMIVPRFIHAIIKWRMSIASTTAETLTLNAAMQSLNVNPVMLAITAVTTLVAGFILWDKHKQKQRQSDIDAANSTATLAESVRELSAEYIKLHDELNTAEGDREKFLDVQDELIDKLKIERYELKKNIEKYGDYSTAIRMAIIEKLKENSYVLTAGREASEETLVNKARNFSNKYRYLDGVIYDADENERNAAKKVFDELELAGLVGPGDIFNDTMSELTGKVTTRYSLSYDSPIKTAEDVQKARDYYYNMLQVAETVSKENFLYRAIRDKYLEYSGDLESYANSVLAENQNYAEQLIQASLLEEDIPKTQKEFDSYRQSIIESAKANDQFVGTENDVIEAIDSVLENFAPFEKFMTIGEDLTIRGFTDILKELQDEYEALSQAMEDMDEHGYLSTDTVESLLEANADLEDQLEKTASGYKISGDALETFKENAINSYLEILASVEEGSAAYEKAYTEFATLLAVIASLDMEKNVKAQTEALDNQLDSYKDIIDIRKELLKTYQDELEYEKELNKKTQNIASLQSRLAVAQLDNSAAGKKRAREIESELNEARDDLNDFTFEHAIEEVTIQLENQYSEYEGLVNKQIEAIKGSAQETMEKMDDVIDRLLREFKEKNPTEPTNLAASGIKGVTIMKTESPSTKNARVYDTYENRKMGSILGSVIPVAYHSGGFVGGSPLLSSNEQFAKLLQGELVSTPAQIDRFMRDTLPKVVSSTPKNEINSPLISIHCESVTKDTLPALEKIVKEAANEVKKQLNSGMSRTGYRSLINR